MTLEEKLDARQIVMKIGMSARPEFYSGRGAIIDDLTGPKLERIYGHIKHEHGGEAAQNFVQMVADIPVLSATDFLLSLYRLEENDWKYDQKLLSGQKGIDIGPDYGDGNRGAIALGTVMTVLSGRGDRNETGAICNLFLRDHGIKILELEDQRGTYHDPFY